MPTWAPRHCVPNLFVLRCFVPKASVTLTIALTLTLNLTPNSHTTPNSNINTNRTPPKKRQVTKRVFYETSGTPYVFICCYR